MLIAGGDDHHVLVAVATVLDNGGVRRREPRLDHRACRYRRRRPADIADGGAGMRRLHGLHLIGRDDRRARRVEGLAQLLAHEGNAADAVREKELVLVLSRARQRVVDERGLLRLAAVAAAGDGLLVGLALRRYRAQPAGAARAHLYTPPLAARIGHAHVIHKCMIKRERVRTRVAPLEHG
eukprot:3183095-Pleurochrysis_carterae.AAC.1